MPEEKPTDRKSNRTRARKMDINRLPYENNQTDISKGKKKLTLTRSYHMGIAFRRYGIHFALWYAFYIMVYSDSDSDENGRIQPTPFV